MIPWTVAHQAPLSLGFSRQDYWSDLLFPSPWDLPNTGIELRPPTLQAGFLSSDPPGKSYGTPNNENNYMCITCNMLLLLFSRSVVQLFCSPINYIAQQTPLSMGFPRQEYLNRLPFSSPGNLPNPGSKPLSPALADGFFSTEPSGKPCNVCNILCMYFKMNRVG